MVITGRAFEGSSEASGGGYNNSATNFPILQLRDFDNSPPLYIPATSWSANSFTSSSVLGIPMGYYQASIITNGIPSPSVVINIVPQIVIEPNSLEMKLNLNELRNYTQ